MLYDEEAFSLIASDHKHRTRRARLWPTAFIVLVLIDVAVFWFYPRGHALSVSMHPPPPEPILTSLDDFQILNTMPMIDPDAISLINGGEHAIVSSLYNDAYAAAIVTLGHSLRKHNTTARMIIIYIEGRLSARTQCLVTAAGWTLHPVPFIAPPHDGKDIIDRFRDQYTKLTIWTLDTIGIKSLVYLDADTLVRRNFDELFTLPYEFAAVPDVWEGPRGYSMDFNAGVLLLRPNTTIFHDMISKLEIARYPPSFAEQAFLNVYFGALAVRLPYMYNGNLAIKRRTPTLWKAISSDMRIIHYTLEKPFPIDDRPRTPQEFEMHVAASKNVSGGVFYDEMSWWEQDWRDEEAARLSSAGDCA